MASQSGSLGIQVDGRVVTVQSRDFSARLDGPALVSFRHRGSDTEFCRAGDGVFPLQLSYVHGDVLDEDKHHSVSVTALCETAARIVVSGDDSDRELLLYLDPAEGDLCVAPCGQSARRGVAAVRWNIPFAQQADLVLPCVNGILARSDRSFPADDRFPWPYRWNAQLVIAQRDGCAMMVHSRDTACKFKALNLARKDGLTTLGFDSEQVGPLWDNRAAGGVEWRLNAFEGSWEKPAGRYRAWMEEAYGLPQRRAARPQWVEDINFSVQWAAAKHDVLDALARLHPPRKTLIHLSNWRTSAYDVDYPTYEPSDEARAYMHKAREMGFRVMPHFNYFACYNGHPLFAKLRDWQIRDVCRNTPQGWYWPPQTYDYTRMGYIHPGLGLWRRILTDAVLGACRTLEAPAAFLDQTLCTWNTDNGLVQNMSTVEGMQRLQEELSAIAPELVLAGEGLNEVSFQQEAFAQAHIHDGWGKLRPEHVEAAHPVCAFLWRGHTRLVGYYHLRPTDEDADLGIEVYRRMGALPTLICNDPALLAPENAVVRRVLDLVE